MRSVIYLYDLHRVIFGVPWSHKIATDISSLVLGHFIWFVENSAFLHFRIRSQGLRIFCRPRNSSCLVSPAFHLGIRKPGGQRQSYVQTRDLYHASTCATHVLFQVEKNGGQIAFNPYWWALTLCRKKDSRIALK